jgi:zinc transport system substrate-binding protein
MILSNCAKDIKKETIKGHNKLDPHIWTSPNNVKIIAKNILDQLIKQDPENKTFYTNNYQEFILKINNLNDKIKSILKDRKNTKFMVFHPAWGYFSKQYNLIQIPIEIDGKSPKPKDLIKIIKEAKKQNIKAILTAPEFSIKAANQIAKQLNIQVKQISPLNPKWENNLLKLAHTIANN